MAASPSGHSSFFFLSYPPCLFLPPPLACPFLSSLHLRFPFSPSLGAQLWPTVCDPMDVNLPGSSLSGILQARLLEQVAISSSRGSSQPRDRTASLESPWQEDSLPLSYLGSPSFSLQIAPFLPLLNIPCPPLCSSHWPCFGTSEGQETHGIVLWAGSKAHTLRGMHQKGGG